MKISEVHLREPGLVVIDVTAADEATAIETAAALGALWLSRVPSAPRRAPGQDVVTARAYADLRRTPLPHGSCPEFPPRPGDLLRVRREGPGSRRGRRVRRDRK